MPVINRLQLEVAQMMAQMNLFADRKQEVFPAFGDLPAEIRRMIWKFAADEPRVLKLVLRRGYPEIVSGGPKVRVLSNCPRILAVCREARLVGQEIYIPFFQFITRQPNAYFYPGRDYIHVPNEMLLQWLFLAIDIACNELIVNGEPASSIMTNIGQLFYAWYQDSLCGYGGYDSNRDGYSSSFLLRVRKFDSRGCDPGVLAKLVVECGILPPFGAIPEYLL